MDWPKGIKQQIAIVFHSMTSDNDVGVRNTGVSNSSNTNSSDEQVLVAYTVLSSEQSAEVNHFYSSSSFWSHFFWISICVAFTLFGIGAASCKYWRDQFHKPENKRRRKERAEEEVKAKEEKAVASVCQDPIPAARFLQILKQKKSDKQLNIEVRAIVRNQEDFPCTVAMSSSNINLNIKQEVVTYDHSRVILWDKPQHVKTDYINASFIDGYYLSKEYIASQGPSNRTVASFWHMIWQEGVHCVVMATGLFENAAQQCEKYWDVFLGVKKYVRHGEIHIWNEDSVFMAQLNIRTFRIQKEGSSEERIVKHFEMVGFHDNEGADPGFILDVRRRVNDASCPGPTLVHCRCGGGRTAVFMAVDYCLKQLESEDRLDIYSCVLHLRRFRKNMVRTLSQYRLIYDTVAMYLQCGWTVYPGPALPATYLRFYSKNADSKTARLEKEFHTLQSIIPRLSIGDCAGGHRVENRSKSRDIMMLPPERARPYLMSTDSGDGGTDFINAVYVDGFHQENSFLCTQWPKKNTVNDLWRMLYDYKINTLVLLNDVKFSRSYPRFWPKLLDDENKFGPIRVKYVGCARYPQIIIRAFSINKSLCPSSSYRDDSFVVKMFQITGSSNRLHGQMSSKSLTYIMHCAAQWQRKTNPLNPICVMSKDGSCRIGIYCSINICCDQLKTDKEMDIFSAARLIKRNRPQLVPNIDEYHYIYEYMADLVATKGAKPKIVITGAEGEATNYAFIDLGQKARESEDELSPRSSRSGSFDTALDDPMDCFLPPSVNAQSKLSACITQLSPHMSPKFFMSDHSCCSSTDSLCGFETASETNNTYLGSPDSLPTSCSQFSLERNQNWSPEKKVEDKTFFECDSSQFQTLPACSADNCSKYNMERNQTWSPQGQILDNRTYLDIPETVLTSDVCFERNGNLTHAVQESKVSNLQPQLETKLSNNG